MSQNNLQTQIQNNIIRQNTFMVLTKIMRSLRLCFPSLIVPTPLEGGRKYILKWIFFVQTILADRYIHRTELRLVSLESLSSVEYGIKNIFLEIRFLQGVIEV